MHVIGILAAVSVLALPHVPASPAEAPSPQAKIDPALAAQVSGGAPAPAILSWDRQQVNRSQVAAYLQANDIDAHLLEGLSIAFACAGPSDVETLASAPGAISVWGDHPLTPALDHSVRTAFNGDPSAIWDGLGYTGKDVAIAVVDTGIDASHPDLEYRSKTKLNVRVLGSAHDNTGPYGGEKCVPPDTYTGQLTDSELTSGHGTHLASVAAGDGTASGGRYRGVAPGASLVGVGVTESTMVQTSACLSDQPCSREGRTYLSLMGALAGMSYVSRNGLGECFPPECPFIRPLPTTKVILAGWTQDGLYDPWHPIASVINELAYYGINVVFPVGNEGPGQSDCSTAETCHFNTFAVPQKAIGVAATPRDSDATLESYSSRGDPVVRQDRDETFRYAPTLSAPGTGVVAARRPGLAPLTQVPGSNLGGRPHDTPGIDRRYVPLTGTSVSAAHVAGAIAVMQEAAVKANGCYLPTSQVIDILRSTADPMPGYESWEVGAGALDVKGAIARAEAGGPASIDPWMCPPDGPVPPIEEYTPTFAREDLFLHRNTGPLGNLDARDGRYLAWDYYPPGGAIPAAYVGNNVGGIVQGDHLPEHSLTMKGRAAGDLDTIAFDLYATGWAQSTIGCPLGLSFQLIVDGVPILDQDFTGSNLGVAYEVVDPTTVKVRFALTNLWEATKLFELLYGPHVKHDVYLNVQNFYACNEIVWRYDSSDRPSGLIVNLPKPTTKGYVGVNVLDPPPPPA